MRLYQFNRARGYSKISIDGNVFYPNDNILKCGDIRPGRPVPEDIGSLDARIYFADSKPLPLPDISEGDWITPFSERARKYLDSLLDVDASWIPLNLIGAGRIMPDGVWEECSLQDCPIEVESLYFSLNINSPSQVLDENKTLMSREYILDPSIPPGNYLRLVFNSEIEFPPVFVLPGFTFGVLVTEKFFSAAKKAELSGIGRRRFINQKEPIDFDALTQTDKKHIVTLREAREIFQELPNKSLNTDASDAGAD